jgi:hypothetical protein
VVQVCEENSQIFNEQFKFASPRTRVTVARLAVALYSPVHSIGLRETDADTAVKVLRNVTHTHTHTHTYIYRVFLE